ncbi:MAG: hypothetical protein IKH09_09885 [Clostridia bacterium]|nr:hypothetical protein [Clostridia bacterium]
MKVLLLGNGFDLYHYLPTTYYCFLTITEYLVRGDTSKSTRKQITIEDKPLGRIMAEVENNCPMLQESYIRYKKEYDSMILEEKEQSSLIKMCENNPWWRFMVEECKNDSNWIDVEKNIRFVIGVFDSFLIDDDRWKQYNGRLSFKHNVSRVTEKVVLDYFDFFEEEIIDNISCWGGISNRKVVKEKYTIKDRFENVKRIDKNKVVESLFELLKQFAQILEFYLYHFVENVIEKRLSEGPLEKSNSFFNSFQTVISFNYTKTYENQYKADSVVHLHGKIGDGVILGINPDSDDEKGSAAQYILFKKYYQRLISDTFDSFRNTIELMEADKKRGLADDVYVLGHSLDITDEDIIREVFSLAGSIYIYYHRPEEEEKYIRNLIRIFGKKEFDDLIRKQRLTFYSIEKISESSIM